eukprot:jgi/Undpi1/5354/HiC_scaffold_2.g00635.m1
MPETEAYRPGLLSSLLLGGPSGGGGEGGNRNATTSSKNVSGTVGVSGVKEPSAGEQQCAESTPAEPSSSATKKNKKKKKKAKKDKGESEQTSAGGNEGGDERGAAAMGAVGQGEGGDSLRPAAAGGSGGGAQQEPLEEAPDLNALFSASNLKKFKRRERVDKEADAAEVRLALVLLLRTLEAQKRLEIAEKRAAALAAAAAAVSGGGGVSAAALSEEEEEEGEGKVDGMDEGDDNEEEGGEEEESGEENEERDSDSEPESVVAGQGGDSSDEEEEDDEKVAVEGGQGIGDKLLTGGGSEASKIEGENAEKDGRPTKKSDAKAGEGDKKELQEEEKEMRTIFVGNLPITFNPKKVKGRFKEYGAIESVRLRSVAVEGMAVDKAGDQASLSPPCLPLPSFRRSIQLVRKVCVNRGMVDKEVKSSVNAYVVYKELASVDKVRKLFCSKLEGGSEAVEGVRLVRDKTTLIGKGFGYVLLADRALAAAALAVQGVKLRGRELRVMPCGKRTKGRGGKAKPGMEDHKFASFEGRRTAVPAGVLRRLKRKQDGEDSASTPGSKHASGISSKSGGSGSGSGFKKPRWTTEDGVPPGGDWEIAAPGGDRGGGAPAGVREGGAPGGVMGAAAGALRVGGGRGEEGEEEKEEEEGGGGGGGGRERSESSGGRGRGGRGGRGGGRGGGRRRDSGKD